MLDQVLQHLTVSELSLAAVVVISVYYVVSHIRLNAAIQRTGGSRAPSIKTWLPLSADFIYQAFQYAKHDENLAFWHKHFNKYGHRSNPRTVEVALGFERIVLTVDKENIKALLATQFHDFGKGPDFNKEWHAFLGNSIFSTDGDIWHDSRALIRPQFVKDRVSDLVTFERHVQPLISRLGNGKGQTVDVKDLFFRYTLDAATAFLFGSSVNSLHHGGEEFAHAFAEIQRIQNDITRAGPMQVFVSKKAFRKHIATLNAFVEPFIDQCLQIPQSELEAKSGNDGENYTFLHAIAAYTKDRKVLRDQLVAVLLAGRDTTACTLSWLFYELARREDIVQTLRDEIEATVGLERPPTYADLKSMKYLQHTINETLRLYSIVPFNLRVALRDATLPLGGGPDGLSPVAVPKGTHVAYSTEYLHLIESHYPPISEKFPDPARFEPRRWANWTPQPWQYIPFNGGPRLCVGQQFALTEMQYTVVRILQRFSRLESRQGPLPSLPSGPSGGFRGSEGIKDQSLVARAIRERITMKSEIVLSPKDAVKVAFFD